MPTSPKRGETRKVPADKRFTPASPIPTRPFETFRRQILGLPIPPSLLLRADQVIE